MTGPPALLERAIWASCRPLCEWRRISPDGTLVVAEPSRWKLACILGGWNSNFVAAAHPGELTRFLPRRCANHEPGREKAGGQRGVFAAATIIFVAWGLWRYGHRAESGF